MARRNRPQRPGTEDQTSTTQAHGGGGGGGQKRKQRKPNRPHGGGNNNKNKNKKPGTDPVSGPLGRGALPKLGPGSNFDSDSGYGYDGDEPYYDTDDGRIDAADHPDQYYRFLNRMAGFSGNTLSPFGAYLNGAGQEEFLNALKNAQKINPHLNPVDFARSMGVPDSAADYHMRGQPGEMGTGYAPPPPTTPPTHQPVGGPVRRPSPFPPLQQAAGGPAQGSAPINTGNAFTSSSGIGGGGGIAPVQQPAAKAGGGFFGQQPSVKPPPPLVRPRFGGGTQPGIGLPPGMGGGGAPRVGLPHLPGMPGGAPRVGLPTVPGLKPGNGNGLDDWNYRQRFAYLSLSPEQRGEQNTMGAAGRWSAWG